LIETVLSTTAQILRARDDLMNVQVNRRQAFAPTSSRRPKQTAEHDEWTCTSMGRGTPAPAIYLKFPVQSRVRAGHIPEDPEQTIAAVACAFEH
jgi:hypothetical protein